MSLEQEIKLSVLTESRLDLKQLDWLMANVVGAVEQVHLANTYFDTPGKELKQFGVGLRLREINGRWLQTVKSHGEVIDGLHQRQEWEQPVAGAAFDLSGLKQTALAPLVENEVLWSTLKPLFTTDFDRQIYQLECDGSQIELAYDRGVVKAGNLQQPLHEIELELKRGDIATCRQLAQQLQTELPLEYNAKSKAESGYDIYQLIEK